MQSLGPDNTQSGAGSRFAAARTSTFRLGSLGMSVLVLAFLVAVIFAANQNSVVGWFVVVISAAWLALAAFVVFGIQRATKRAAAKLAEAGNAFNAAAGRAPSSASEGTRLVEQDGESARMRDMKLDHSFKIVQVQARVIEEQLAKGDEGDAGMVTRALETITITSSNARDMIKSGGTTDEPVSGTVID
ncbi:MULTISPECIES: hypothetical protein [Arthrobacter]|uniref:Uncharacterized protein n=2 Tax=Arthrobacter TaxID=1663 RepID=A0ABU9KKL9_9MICC|nr:hypothetical protein [Arthrobacter sp. YJM1]MDP5227454.1 hypothetical protein [Arthrobacter sp. YJM1]